MTIEVNKSIRDSQPKLAGIEAGRGIAAIMVVLFHATGIMNLPKYFSTEPLNGFFNFGYAGVDFFFVLSGFIILFIHFDDIEKKGVFGSYVRKRFLRIYPIYWVVSFLVIAALFFIPSIGPVPDASYIIQSLLLIPQNTMPLVIVAWTLTHEIFFYIIFGFIIYRRNLGLFIIGAWFLGILTSAIFDLKFNYFFNFIFSINNIGFFLGMAIALAARSFNNIHQPRLIAAVGIILFLATGMLNVYSMLLFPKFFTVLYAISSSLIIFGLVISEREHRFNIKKWFALLGASSYSIYLIHFLALSFFIKILKKLNIEHVISINVIFFILVIAVTLTGILFHILIEKPLLAKLMKKKHPNVLLLKTIE